MSWIQNSRSAALSLVIATLASAPSALAQVTGTPSFVVSYTLPADQNVVPVQNGGLIPFPPTLITATAQATLSVTNTGTAPGVVNDISITGTAFRLSGRPLLPATVAAGQSIQLQILYQPSGVTSDTGRVQVTLSPGGTVAINLSGSGTAASFSYQLLTTPPATIAPGGTIPLPNTSVGQSSTVTLRVVNTGSAAGVVNSINIAGTGFTLTNNPILPQTIAPNAGVNLTLNFTPTIPGSFTGSLFVNSDSFSLTGVGLGPQLSLSYINGGTTVTLNQTNTSVVFSPVAISQSSQVTFVARNSGTLPTVLQNLGVGQNNSPYSLTGLPPVPVTLAPNTEIRFTISFTPTVLGFSNGTLQLDTLSVPLVGSGTQPPALPAYTITGASGTVAAGTQPNIALTLASGYPVAISGTLALSLSGSLPADPAVQFASGGLSVPFTIPANGTSAVFGTQGTQIGLQTGTVASNFTLTPTFATRAGGVDLTPSSPATLQFAVGSAAPTLVSLQISAPTANGFVISVTGFSTTRALAAWNVQFTTMPGFNMPVSKFTVDLQQVAAFWFQSAASRAFGSQFTLSIPFTFQGTAPTGQTIVNSIATVGVTVGNATGTSNLVEARVN